MSNALIVGIDSTIGQALKNGLTDTGWSVLGTSRREGNVNTQILHLDLANSSAFQIKQPIDVVYLCAGMTTITGCDDDPAYTRKINVDAPIYLAHYFLNRGVHVVYLSSNAVFSGEKSAYRITDNPSPLTLYGQCKSEVEAALLTFATQVSIVRITKVFTQDYPLILKWLTALKKREYIHPFHDRYLSPVFIDSVVDCLIKVAERKVYGITHLSGTDDVTYLDVANYLVKLIGANPDLIQSQSENRSTGVIRPVYASLDMIASQQVFDEPPDLSFSGTMRSVTSNYLIHL